MASLRLLTALFSCAGAGKFAGAGGHVVGATVCDLSDIEL